MSKILLIVLIFGGILVGVGIGIIYYNEEQLIEKYPDLVIFFDDELAKAQRTSTPINLSEGDHITITIINQNPPDKLFFSLVGPEESILETFFSDYISFQLEANSTGTYLISVGNTEPHNVHILGFVTENPVIDKDFIETMSSVLMISTALVFLGIIIIISSVVILLIQKIRSKNHLKKI